MLSNFLAFDAPLTAYEEQARRLLAGHGAAEPDVLEVIRLLHPRWRRAGVAWMPERVSPEVLASTAFDFDDARTVVASGYGFADWAALEQWVTAVWDRGDVHAFEAAVEAVVDGDLPTLTRALDADPGLVRARSTRRTCFDPSEQRATLLHYVAANGVEGHRQRVPANAVAIARTLLSAGAEVDALAGFYGTECATLPLLVSSSHPAAASVHEDLVEVFLDFGASLEGHGEPWGTPLMTALTFGFGSVADVLVRRGAPIADLATAAALGRGDLVAASLDSSSVEERHRAMALAAQLGRVEVVRLLLDAGEDPDRFNPKGAHPHATPLHQAVNAGHEDVVRLLVARGARLDLRDTLYAATPLQWALHAGHDALATYLKEQGAE